MTSSLNIRTRAVMLTLAALGAQTVDASPIEHAVDTTGKLGAISLAYGDHTINAALATALETDRYTFAAAAGEQFELRLQGFGNYLNPEVALRDSGGAVVKTAGCAGYYGGPCSLALDYTATRSGVMTLNVFDSGADSPGTYQLHLEQIPPKSNWVGIRYDTAVNDSIQYGTDIDMYGFRVNSATGVRVSLRGFGNNYQPSLQLWTPAGGLAKAVDCSGYYGGPCTVSMDLTPAAGVYTLGVSDIGMDNAGNYQLEISCLFGNCPTALALPPSPVPEPASGALMLFGGALLSWLGARRRRA